MIRNVWAVLCGTAIENSKTKNLSLIEAFGGLRIVVPSSTPDIFHIQTDHTLGTLWLNTDTENIVAFTVKLSLILPSGKEIEQAKMEKEVEAGAFWKWVVHIQTLTIAGPGLYRLVLRVKKKGAERWKRGAITPFKIEYDTQEDAVFLELPPRQDGSE